MIRWWLYMCALSMMGGCAATDRTNSSTSRAHAAYLPMCFFLCFATGEATQAEGGDAKGGKVESTDKFKR